MTSPLPRIAPALVQFDADLTELLATQTHQMAKDHALTMQGPSVEVTGDAAELLPELLELAKVIPLHAHVPVIVTEILATIADAPAGRTVVRPIAAHLVATEPRFTLSLLELTMGLAQLGLEDLADATIDATQRLSMTTGPRALEVANEFANAGQVTNVVAVFANTCVEITLVVTLLGTALMRVGIGQRGTEDDESREEYL